VSPVDIRVASSPSKGRWSYQEAAMDENDPRHGTLAGRRAHQRANERPCERCREADADRARRDRKKRKQAGIAPDDHRHGTRRGYEMGCREDCCRTAYRAYRRAERAGKLSKPKTCQNCGRKHRGSWSICRTCARQGAWPEEEVALEGGQWKLDPARRIQVWQEAS